MTCRKISKIQPGEVPWATQVQFAIIEYKSTKTSFRTVGGQYDVAWTTIRDRIEGGAISRKLEVQARQYLIPAEEDILQEYCLLLKR
jgi:hypothetical protein